MNYGRLISAGGTIVENHTLGYGEKTREIIADSEIVDSKSFLIRGLTGGEYCVSDISRIEQCEGIFNIEMDYPVRNYVIAPRYIEIPKNLGKNASREKQ